MIQVHYTYCALYFYYYYIVIYNEIIIQLTIMLTGGRAQEVMRVMGSGCKYRWSCACSPTTHFLLCDPVPNRPVPVRGTGVGDPCSNRLWLVNWAVKRGFSKIGAYGMLKCLWILAYCVWCHRNWEGFPKCLVESDLGDALCNRDFIVNYVWKILQTVLTYWWLIILGYEKLS